MTKKKIIETKIISNKNICQDHFVMQIDSGYLSSKSKPGQFVNVKLDARRADPLLRIPLGIHDAGKGTISLLYKVVGEGTGLLARSNKNENISILGPLGNGFNIDKQSKEAFLVAGGHGVAPLYFLAKELIAKKQKVRLFIGSSTKKHIVCSSSFKKIGVKVHIATDDGSCGHKGFVTELLEEHLQKPGVRDEPQAAIYACGPKPMLKAVSGVCKKRNISAQVSVDEYMACGIGACLGCAIKTIGGYKMVCKDGPVFKPEEIVWE